MAGPTREEFDRLYTTIDEGFRGTHERLDVLNGRIGKGEVAFAVSDARLASVEQEVFTHPQRRKIDVEEPPRVSRKRDHALVALGVATIVAAVKFLLLTGETTVALLKLLVLKGGH